MSKEQLRAHRLIHARDRTYDCHAHGQSFRTFFSLKRHQDLHGKKTNLQRRVVTGVTFTSRECGIHKKKSSKYKLHCNMCGVEFSHRTQRRWHQCDHQGALRGSKGFRCEQCGIKCLSVKTLQKHLLLHSPARRYQCSQCSHRFHKSRCLKNHLATHQAEKPHMCDVCGRTFALKARLKDHQLLHLKVKPHPCSKCGKSFIRPYLLKEHLLKEHPWSYREDGEKSRAEHGSQGSESQDTGEKEQRAVWCERRQEYKQGRAFECSHCGKKFTKKHRLIIHTCTHSEEGERYRCDRGRCSRSFATAAELRRHLQFHSGLGTKRRFQCSQCERSFKMPQYLKLHQRMHTGPRLHGAKKSPLRRHCSEDNQKAQGDADDREDHTYYRSDPSFDPPELHLLLQFEGNYHRHKSEDSDNESGSTLSAPVDISVDHYTSQLQLEHHQGSDPLVTYEPEQELTLRRQRQAEIHNVSSNDSLQLHKETCKNQCDVCGRSFKQPRYLREHKRLHLEHKPHTCADCGKGFVKPHLLREHRARHHGEGKWGRRCFLCKECGVQVNLGCTPVTNVFSVTDFTQIKCFMKNHTLI